MKFKAIRTGINYAKDKANSIQCNAEDLKVIVFSDHHRGIKDSADDFKICEPTYLKALDYYYKKGFILILLGDVEELWENEPIGVITKYKEVIEAEKKFFVQGKMIRIWGNHDDIWQFKDKVNELLEPIFPNINPVEAVEIIVHNNHQQMGKILFLHGHQGTLLSSKYAGISKLFVRYLWRPIQRIFKISLPTAAKNEQLEYQTDKALDYWASMRNRQLIVAGHTHSYLFGSFALIETNDKPCYFNTGYCSNPNGSITGLEISNENIKLINWNQNDKTPTILQEESLLSIFNRCDDMHW